MNSIVRRLWLALVVTVAVILLAVGLLLAQLFNNFYFNLQADNLIAQGENLGQMVLASASGVDLARELSLVEDFLNANVLIIDRNGLISGASPGMHHQRRFRGADSLTPPQAAAVLSGRTVVIRRYREQLEATMLIVAVPVRTSSQVVGAVYLYTPLAPITETIAAVRRLIIYGILSAMAVVTVLAFFISKRLSRPLITMERAAHTMAGGDFSPRVQVESDDEIGRLGAALNHLAAELARTLASLGAERDQLAEILGGMTDGVLTFSAGGELLLFNPPAAEYLADVADLAVGQRLGEEIVLPELQEQLRRVLASGSAQGAEFQLGERTVVARLAPLKEESGIRAIVCVLLDMTRERRLEEMRREFVANVSHELRTPLTYLQGYAEAIIDGLPASREEEERYLKIILDETLRLRRLVDDLLDLARIEAGQLVLSPEPVDLRAQIDDVAGKLQPLAAAKEVRLLTDVATDLPAVMGSPDHLQQILINLINNALRYTPAGGAISVAARSDGEGKVEVEVQDSGAGIPAADLPFIFERFYKQEKARTRSSAGTGIGLAIVRGLVRAHGGEITVSSEPGRGTCFAFTLPTAPTSPA